MFFQGRLCFYGPLEFFCDRTDTPFGTLQHAAVHVYYLYDLLSNTLDFYEEQEAKWSKIWFGDRDHQFLNIRGLLNQYLFKYIELFNPLGGDIISDAVPFNQGAIDDTLSILELFVDKYIDDYVFEMVKGPICGIVDTEDDHEHSDINTDTDTDSNTHEH